MFRRITCEDWSFHFSSRKISLRRSGVAVKYHVILGECWHSLQTCAIHSIKFSLLLKSEQTAMSHGERTFPSWTRKKCAYEHSNSSSSLPFDLEQNDSYGRIWRAVGLKQHLTVDLSEVLPLTAGLRRYFHYSESTNIQISSLPLLSMLQAIQTRS